MANLFGESASGGGTFSLSFGGSQGFFGGGASLESQQQQQQQQYGGSPPQQQQQQQQCRGASSPGEADMRNMTRRGRPGGEERSMSLAGEGRLLQLESENSSLRSEVERLRERVARLETRRGRSSRSSSMASMGGGAEDASSRRPRRAGRRRHLLRDSILHTVESGGPSVRVERDKISRTASIGTASVLRALPRSMSTSGQSSAARAAASALAERVIEVFREPLAREHTQYLCSQQFADDLIALSEAASRRFEREPRLVRLESPCYVFGDVHGNLEDLHFFSDHVWKLGVALVAGHLLFLGDYVDRGLSSLEVVAYLLALKVYHPRKVCLLRGNHETRDVNGWKEHYGDRSFLWQCEHRFGAEIGARVWDRVNAAFDRLPLAALVDDEIFCVHGGIPRRPADADPAATRLDLIDCVPPVMTINPQDPAVDPSLHRIASECVWSDPALEDQEPALDDDGFGESMRGGGTMCFGNAAIQRFLAETGCSFIMRAHEAHAYGVSLSKMATVFTIFSTSKDHHQGKMAKAGCVLVDLESIQVINRSPHYKNRFVHRRNSVSLVGLAPDELRRRAALGLVVPDDDDTDDEFAYQDDILLEDDYDDDDDDDDDDLPGDRRGPAARLVDANYSFMPDDDR